MFFRELGIRRPDGRFAAVAEQIIDRVERGPGVVRRHASAYSVGEFLAEALAYPDLTAVLPRPLRPPSPTT